MHATAFRYECGEITLISQDAYDIFFKDFINNKYPDQRHGQAFLNTFFPQVSDPEIFYTRDIKVSQTKIFQFYIDPATMH